MKTAIFSLESLVSIDIVNDKILQYTMIVFFLILIGYVAYNPNKINEHKSIAFQNGATLICSIMAENDYFNYKNSAIFDDKYVVNSKGIKYKLDRCSIGTK